MGEVVEIEIPYQPRKHQAEVHESLTRFNVLVCHRRFGKTVLGVNELIKRALTTKLEAPRAAYIAPLYRQAKAVAWDYLLKYTTPIPKRQVNQAELRVDLPNGGRVQLFGADNPDSLRGLYFDFVVLDEPAQMSGRVWGEVVRPALADRAGGVLFIGTPQGHNAFWEIWEQARKDDEWLARMYRASETDIVAKEELERARRAMSPEQYAQEFECSFQAAILGAYYGTLLEQLDADGHICRVPHDAALRTETWWDLGIGDATAIWFAQRLRSGEVHVIDYYEATGEPLSHYVGVLDRYQRERGYQYGDHVFPHDVRARELTSGKSRQEVLESLGLKPRIVAQHRVEDGIEAVRRMLGQCWFDTERCKDGLEAMRQYRKEYDDRRSLPSRPVFSDRPLHDWTSHAADAFRYGAMHRTGREFKPLEYDLRWVV